MDIRKILFQCPLKQRMTMEWKKLISNKRLGQELKHFNRHDDRSEFKRDYDRLIFSAPFRRLQNKTQVFPLPGGIFVHNRLTHSLEVSSVGMSLGADVAQILKKRHPELADTLFEEIGPIVCAACLAHDMGNPPFGHSGEKAIQTFFTEGAGKHLKERVSNDFWNDITHFEGNANAFRLLTHRDVLGSLMGLGIDRSKFGDVIVQQGGAQIMVDESVADFVIQNFTKIAMVSVSVEAIELSDIAPKEEKIKEVRTTVASLRLDAVASSGFSVSRTKLVSAINAGLLQVNWQPAKGASQEVKEGDVISMRGRGRMKVEAITGTSRKGRIGVYLKRFM